jgi:TonB family protein
MTIVVRRAALVRVLELTERLFSRKAFSHLTLMLAGAGTLAGAFAAIASESIVQQRYPAESLARGEQGEVEFSVDLDSQAKILSCVVTKSSGYALLDEATCDVIVIHASFPPAIADGKRVATTRTGRINWTLPERYKDNAKLAPKPAAFTSAELESRRIICRKHQAAGSLVKARTYCLTRAQWDIAESEAQTIVNQMVNPVATPHGCSGNPDC